MSGAKTQDLAAHIRTEDRIIEVGPRDASVAHHLARHGSRRYLALVEDDALDAVKRDAGELADRFYPLSATPDLRAVDADVLILRGRAVRHLWLARELRGVRIVIVPVWSGEARLVAGFQRLLGTLRPLGPVMFAGRRHRILEMRGRSGRARTRVHLSPLIGYTGLFGRLDDVGVRAVVLRWFDSLPDLEPGEDVDLLVADEHVDKVRAVIAEEPGTLPIDLYSVTGLPGSDREGVACYPPQLAHRILTRATPHWSGAWVPAPDDHLNALAHHVVYHKGETSGLPTRLIDDTSDVESEHEYGAILAGLADELGIKIPQDLEGLDEYLENAGWRPPMDTLRRLSTTNRWVQRRFFPERRSDRDEPEPAVFVLRRRALDVLAIRDVRRVLHHLGFEVIGHRELDPPAAWRCQTQLRGGNWGRGPYPTSGGPPASVLVGLHYGPRAPNSKSRADYPHLTNLDVLAAKEMLRDLVNERVSQEQRCNPVHSSDNEEEAWEYVRAAMPDELPRLKEMVESRRAEYRTPVPVVDVLRRGRRAKVELVEFDGTLAVRKTFGHGYLRHLEREKKARHAFAGHTGLLPLLASGPNWIVCPYLRDQLRYDESSPRLVPLRILGGMVQILHTLHEAGFALIDAKPGNFLMAGDDMNLIDLEFLYEYPGEPPPFHRSLSWHGAPRDATMDLPVGPLSYDETWLRWTGLPVVALCYGTPRQQRVLRARYRARLLARWITRAVVRGPARVASEVWADGHGLRARGRTMYGSWARSRALAAPSHGRN